MSNTSSHASRSVLAAAVHLALAGGLLTGWQPGAQAQASAPVVGQSPQAPATRAWDIPAGPLDAALARFVTESGIPLAATPALVQGRQSQGVRGSLGVPAALEELLSGTGLKAERNAQGEYRLRVVEAGAATADAAGTGLAILPTVTVKGLPELGSLTEGTGSYTTRSTSAATGMNLPLRETPQSVTVITRERMDDQALDSFEKVMEQAPGIHQQWTGPAVGGSNSSAYARGYRVNNYQIDGVTVPSDAWALNGWGGGAALDTAFYDSVAVVRGATGLLSGAGDPSASISLTRKRPTREFQASVAQSLGSWNQRRSVADVGGPLNTAGSLRGRLVAFYDEGGSWSDRYQGYHSGAYGVLEADLGDKTTLNLSLEHARETANNVAMQMGFTRVFTDGSLTPFSRSNNPTTGWSHWHSKRTTLSAALEHRFSEDWQGRLTYGHSSKDLASKTGVAGGFLAPPLALDGMGIMSLRNNLIENRGDVLDAKLNGHYTLLGRKHELVAGFNTWDSDQRMPRSLNVWDTGDRVQVLDWDGSGYSEPDWSAYAFNSSATRIRQSGAYLATRLHATDGLSLIAGARWNNWKTRARNLITGTVTDDRKESGVITPYAAVMYDLTRQVSAYVSYTEIFNPQSAKDVTGSLLDPETGKNVELGLKGEWLGGRLNASAAVFQSGKDNMAIADGTRQTPEGDQAYMAADDTKARGWELEVAGQLAPGWQVQGGYSRVLLEDSSGERLETNLPKHQFKLFTTLTPAGLHRLTVGGGVLWQSTTYDDSAPHLSQKSFALVNLMASYAFDERLSLVVRLNNVFDKTYHTYPSLHYYGAPRNLYATLKYRF